MHERYRPDRGDQDSHRQRETERGSDDQFRRHSTPAAWAPRPHFTRALLSANHPVGTAPQFGWVLVEPGSLDGPCERTPECSGQAKRDN